MKRDPLRQETRDLQMEVSEEADTTSTLPQRLGARIARELRQALPPTIFFFVGFNFHCSDDESPRRPLCRRRQ
jgi:hypothetical protein